MMYFLVFLIVLIFFICEYLINLIILFRFRKREDCKNKKEFFNLRYCLGKFIVVVVIVFCLSVIIVFMLELLFEILV